MMCCPHDPGAKIKGVPVPRSYSPNRQRRGTGLTVVRELWAINIISPLRSVGRAGSLGFLPLEPNPRRHHDALCYQWGGM
jgi:hypothetical protein